MKYISIIVDELINPETNEVKDVSIDGAYESYEEARKNLLEIVKTRIDLADALIQFLTVKKVDTASYKLIYHDMINEDDIERIMLFYIKDVPLY